MFGGQAPTGVSTSDDNVVQVQDVDDDDDDVAVIGEQEEEDAIADLVGQSTEGNEMFAHLF